MPDAVFDAIPAHRRDIARVALTAAFGSTQLTALHPLVRGSGRPLLYRIEVDGRPYLLRLETGRDFFRNPERGYACMRAAVDAEVAPPVHHADPIAGVAIMDFVAERPLYEHPGGPAGLVRGVGSLIARLQTTPAFPPLGDYLIILDRMLAHVQASGVIVPGLLDPHREGFDRIRQAYRWGSDTQVSSHNDLNAGNVMFDGERLWLIDWEIAFCNDPLVDIAIAANTFAPSRELEDVLLETWLGRPPDRALRARMVVMRLLTTLFYGCIALSVSIGRRPQETSLLAPSLAELQAALAQGRLAIGAPETLHVFSKVCLADFVVGLAAPGLAEALVVARGG